MAAFSHDPRAFSDGARREAATHIGAAQLHAEALMGELKDARGSLSADALYEGLSFSLLRDQISDVSEVIERLKSLKLHWAPDPEPNSEEH